MNTGFRTSRQGLNNLKSGNQNKTFVDFQGTKIGINSIEIPVIINGDINWKLIQYLYFCALQKINQFWNKMAGRITLTMIKPLSVEKGVAVPILAKINEAGFRISGLKMVRLTTEQAKKFYEVHKERPFYNDLVSFMTSGPIVAAILEKDNAVEEFRNLIGSTDPSKAAQGTIRALYGTSVEKNAVHGSDSDENARIESDFFFSKLERF